MIAENNYKYNCRIYDKSQYDGMINGQALGCVAVMRYGLFNMSFNGCEVIAVHNALVYLEKACPVYEIARYMEKFRMLSGFFGCNPHKTGKALEHYGIKYEKSGNIRNSDVFVLSFWTGRRFLSSIHTVFCVRRNNGIIVYNRYNNCPEARIYRNDSGITEQKKIIAVYTIKGA